MNNRKLAFVLGSTDHGSMIVNRFDYNFHNGTGYGVGYNLLENASFDTDDVTLLKQILDLKRQTGGDGVIALDGGANIGVHTIEWARHMTGWGYVIGIEAQERVFYALAGNVALNNCFNARVLNAALSNTQEPINIPVPDYCSAGSFGNLELRENSRNEYIGQAIDYGPDSLTEVACLTIDSFNLPRLDLLKIDVEGMEIEVLEGARESLRTLNPVIFIEYIKVGHEKLIRYFAELDYVTLQAGINLIALHKNDPLIATFAPLLQKSMREFVPA